jgi:hypothetical protein
MRSGLVLLGLFVLSVAQAQQWDFSLHKHSSAQSGPTLLVIGGIQGDEPGGFNAASLLVTNYKLQRGELWVVPNLNFESIIKRSRGVYGDMNRKFKSIQVSDPEYRLVDKIKHIITDAQVDVILNLHDGSGFYRPRYVDRLHNPERWGQSLIIDQEHINTSNYGRLKEIALGVTQSVNRRLGDARQYYYVKNTRTRLGNVEMEKTLTYYAIQRGKAAFGIEASKAFNTEQRVYFHLAMVEAFMDYLGISYERNFELGIDAIRDRIDNNIKLAMYQSRLYFDMANVRERLYYVPMKKGSPLEYTASNPLIAVLNEKQNYNVRYGNRNVTELVPQYFPYDESIASIPMLIDGNRREVAFGEVVKVNETFEVLPMSAYRVNVIGYTQTGVDNEQGITIHRHQFIPRYSVDREARTYRVEVYRDQSFCGMVLVDFGNASMSSLKQPAVDQATVSHTQTGS